MNLSSEFQKEPFFPRLQARADTFRRIIEHIDACDYNNSWIVETGTARIKDNWEGDGQSTLIWDWVCDRKKDFNALSIDITPEYVELAKAQTKNVLYNCSDSLLALSKLDEEVVRNIRVLYLDSFDWSPELAMDSAFHHMCELATIWTKLSEGCLIVVDDRHGPFHGKHIMVQMFMEKLGINPLFLDYQAGWVKPLFYRDEQPIHFSGTGR